VAVWTCALPAATAGSDPATATVSELRAKRVLPYAFEHAWPTAVRYLRVDRGFSVTERDEDAGFILFEFQLGGEGPNDPVRVGWGSMELLRTKDVSGREAVQVQVATGAGPVHLPSAITDGLADKLRAERGPPPPPPRPAPSEPGPDAPPKDEDPGVPLVPPAENPNDFGRDG
jgi:hypothetical protein